MSPRHTRAAAALGLCLAALPVITPMPLAGQETGVVALQGAGDPAVDRRLARLLRADPLLVTRDTAFIPGDTVRGSVLVLDATIVHEGVVLGDLVLVDASAYVRPRAVVAGDLVNIAGGLYRSHLAEVGGEIVDLPVAPYEVIREADRLIIRATTRAPPLALDGPFGLHAPTYDRVNGLTLAWGARYQLPSLAGMESRVRGRIGWQTQRGDPTWGLELGLRRSEYILTAGHERVWDTNERWIRGDLMNSLIYLWDGTDLRDYHDAERTWVGLSRNLTAEGGRLSATAWVRVQREDATSLPAGEPWFLWGSGTRPNPPVDDGRIFSLVAAVDAGWEASQTLFSGRAELEAAGTRWGGEFPFQRVTATGSWAMLALANHSLAIDFFLQTPLGDPLPRQRWSFVGGSNTLHTLELAEHYGDHVVFVETRYIIPMPDRLALPLVGAPRLNLVHATGMAWTGEERPGLHQEVGLMVDFLVAYLRIAVVPDDLATRDLSVGLAWPFGRRYPWEQ